MIRILEYGQVLESEIFARTVPTVNVEAVVSEIIDKVKKEGDTALKFYCEKFDGAVLESLEVSKEEFDEAIALMDEDFLRIIKDAAENIRRFHQMQKREGFQLEGANGEIVGQRILPVDKAGLYVPGGTAAYPSTVLMDSIPAKIAGVEEIVRVTPPGKNGKVAAPILAAA